jgi:uncharacterized protein YbbC (DUF1343 family)
MGLARHSSPRYCLYDITISCAQGGAHENASAAFGETYFTITFSKHSVKTVSEARRHVTDVEGLDPIRSALVMILYLKSLYRDRLRWRYDS